MTVQTPDVVQVPREGQPAPSAPKSAVQIKDTGEGAIKAHNPFESMMLPTFTEDEYAQRSPVPERPAAGASSKTAAKLIERAKSFIGTPYKWGGTSPLGFDCSGFTQFLYREIGIDLPRVSYQQGTYGKRISLDELRPGDLVLWDNSSRNNGADHVAIYIGNGQVIHAPKPGDRVKISPLYDRGRAWGVAMNL